MTIRKMEIGGTYLANDGYGYDKVVCLEVNPQETPAGCYGVKVRYVDTNATDIWYEYGDFAGIYVEPCPNT